MRFHKLKTRIVAAFAVLFLLSLALELVIINGILVNSESQNINDLLSTGDHLLKFLNKESNQTLIQAAGVLSADFAFREAVASADRGTIISVLANHGNRIKADVMFLVGTDNVIIADTIGENKPMSQFPFQDLIRVAEQQRQASATVIFHGKLYQLVVVPVLAPTPIAWLASGFIIDDTYAKNLKSLTGLEVSFLTHTLPKGQWKLLATSLPAQQSALLPDAMPDITVKQENSTIEILLADDSHLAHISTVVKQSDKIIVAVLQRSLLAAMGPLHRLQWILLALSGLSFVAMLIAGNWIAHGITKPIRELGMLAQRIELGDYSQSVVLDREDEIGQLVSTFNHMSEGIATRESKIVELAYQDPLTGLPNRRLFHDRLEQAIKASKRSGEPLAILVMDLDRFKEVNDIMGHHVGDLLLQEVTKRLQTTVMRGSDTIARLKEYADTVARLGGDEFAILLTACDVKGAQIVVNRLLQTIEKPTLLEGQSIIINGSFGIVSSPEHGNEINTLLRHADLAMYAAKQANSGYAVFDSSLDSLNEQHLSLMAELHNAVEQNELSLYYQPKVDVASGTISHVEALIRWIHPKRGLIPPDHFIPFAENTGFIKIITKWVIERALHQQKIWREQGLKITVAVNLSARDILVPGLPALFTELMNKYGAASDWLSLEITESSIMTDPKSALITLNKLQEMGLSLSIDDFGTGYSSLTYLKKLPVTELKIDKSFISDMENNTDDATIVHSTIDLAHNMGLRAVAEGVENKAVWDKLQVLGCDFIQGYYISRPLPAEELEQWFKTSLWKVTEVA